MLLMTIGHALAALLTLFGASQIYSAGAESMAPTIRSGEVFLVLSGGFLRGDVAVFDHRGTRYVKRVVGVEGDKIQLRNGRLFLNGAIVQRELLGSVAVSTGGRRETLLNYREFLPEEGSSETISYQIYEISDSTPLDNTREFSVPPRHVFVLGDNRDYSLDSRVANGMGMVPVSALRGRAWLILRAPTPGRAGLLIR